MEEKNHDEHSMIAEKENLEINTDSLGIVQLKRVALNDLKRFQEKFDLRILDETVIDFKEFTAKVLYLQLISPNIELQIFQELPDKDLLNIGRTFIEKEKILFRSFEDTGDFYKDFTKAILYNIISIKKGAEIITGVVQYMKNDFNTHFIEVIKNFKFAKELIANAIRDTLQKLTFAWNKWVSENRESIYKQFDELRDNLQIEYQITEEKTTRFLKKYKFFLTPSLSIDFIVQIIELSEKEGRQDKAIRDLFYKYFSCNNWENLEYIVNTWQDNKFFVNRIPILKDCVATIKAMDGKKVNIVHVVLPTLISQIDGVLYDYLDLYNISSCRRERLPKFEQFKEKQSLVLSNRLDELANFVFLDILFKQSKRGKAFEGKIQFSRHKIVHGEKTNYGRKDYLIRAILILDFLAHLEMDKIRTV